MPSTFPKASPRLGREAFARSLIRFTVAINRIAANSPAVNAYSLRNEILLEMEKRRIRYRDGRTLEGYAAKRLFEDARRIRNHRRTLARNMDAQSGQSRPDSVCAHHIVATQDIRAEESRTIIFGWGIGINDADNGVYLPQFAGTPVPSMPDAPLHGPIHTARYHSNVLFRLGFGESDDREGGRAILRDIKQELTDGSFPWRE